MAPKYKVQVATSLEKIDNLTITAKNMQEAAILAHDLVMYKYESEYVIDIESNIEEIKEDD